MRRCRWRTQEAQCVLENGHEGAHEWMTARAALDELDEAKREVAEYRRFMGDGADGETIDELVKCRIALQKVSEIRDSIVGMQGFNFSEHAYPLVAVLDGAGFKGSGYEIASKNLGTLIEQANVARARLADAVECLAAAFGDYCEANPDPDHAPEPWADEAQAIIGSDRALDIFKRRAGG